MVGGMTVELTYASTPYCKLQHKHRATLARPAEETRRTYSDLSTDPLTRSKYLGAPYMQGLLWRRLKTEL